MKGQKCKREENKTKQKKRKLEFFVGENMGHSTEDSFIDEKGKIVKKNQQAEEENQTSWNIDNKKNIHA